MLKTHEKSRFEVMNGNQIVKTSRIVVQIAEEKLYTNGSGMACFLCETVDPADYDRVVVETLQSRGIELVVLAGFLSILGKPVIDAYPGRILNIHPSLIPSFCGAGFYGLRVHQAALDYGVKVTGATVHLVNEIPDGGRILLQKAVDVLPDDTPETLQRRVMEQAEWKLLPQAVAMLCEQLEQEKKS